MSDSVVGRLRATLGLDSTQFSAGLRRARGETQQFSTAMAGGIRGLAGAFVGLVGLPLTLGAIATGARAVVSTLSALGKQARDTGLDVEELQGLTRGLQRSTRLSADQIGTGFETFAQNVGQAVNGAGPLVDLFDSLGISVRDSTGEVRSQRELLDEVATAIRRARTEQERLTIAQVAFGESGRRMAGALVGGPEALARMVQDARSAGDIIAREAIARAEELDDQFDAVARRITTLAQQAVVGLAMIYDAAVDALTTTEAEQAAADLEASHRSLAEQAYESHHALIRLADAAAAAGNTTLADVLAGIVEQMVRASQLFNDGAINGDQFRDVLATLTGAAETATGAISGIDDVTMDNATAVIDALQARLVELGQQAATTAGQVAAATITPARQVEGFWDTEEGRFDLSRFAPTRAPRPRRAPALLGEPGEPGTGGGSGGGAAGFAGAVADIQQRTRDLLAEADALAEVAQSGRIMGDATDYARTRAELLNAAIRDGRADTPELRAEIDAMARAFVEAGGRVDQLTQALREQERAGERGAGVLTDLFMAIGQGGDAARAAVARLIAELARMQMMRAFQGLASGGGGGFVTGLGRLFMGGSFGGFFANGGFLGAGKWGIAGENGPEPVIGPAQIVSNRQAFGGGGTLRVVIDPSALFDAHIEGRATQVAVQVTQRGLGAVRQGFGATARDNDLRGL